MNVGAFTFDVFGVFLLDRTFFYADMKRKTVNESHCDQKNSDGGAFKKRPPSVRLRVKSVLPVEK